MAVEEEREQGVHIYTISYELLFQDQIETLFNFCRTREQRLDAVSPTTRLLQGGVVTQRAFTHFHVPHHLGFPRFLIHSDPHLMKDGYISLNNVPRCTPLTLVWLEL